MAQLIFDIPDAAVPRLLAGYNGYYDYETRKRPNETPVEFAKRMITAHILEAVGRWEAERAAEQARNQAIKDVRENISIT